MYTLYSHCVKILYVAILQIENAKGRSEMEDLKQKLLKQVEQAESTSDQGNEDGESETEKKRKAEEEAKQKADKEAKKKAEEEAKQKAEKEAKKEEEEAKRKAEKEAKKKAIEEAKQKAEKEAKEKAEEEAKLKADKEAKKKVEKEQAKKKADKEAEQKTQEKNQGQHKEGPVAKKRLVYHEPSEIADEAAESQIDMFNESSLTCSTGKHFIYKKIIHRDLNEFFLY